MTDRLLSAALRRDRLFVAVCLGVATASAWLYLVVAGSSAGHAAMPADAMAAGRWMTDAALLLVMWWAMMLAMMLPSAAPMILLFAAVVRKKGVAGGSPGLATGLFVGAYSVVWGAFGVVATAAQWGLDDTAAELRDPRLVGGLLVLAGLYQLTPWKHACLRRCRSPLDFLLTRWRSGPGGAFAMGAEHGAYCLGCCWLMMTLLFVAGVMNLVAVAAIASFVLVEKVAPAGHRIGRLAGIGLVATGSWIFLAAG